VTTKIAFASRPGDTPQVYTDVSAYTREAHVAQSRQYELDRMESAEWSGLFDNSDRRFDPAYAGSPYSPNLKRGRRVQQTITVSGSTYYLFTGEIDDWPIEWQMPDYSQVTLKAFDFGEAFQNDAYTGSVPEELSGARINRLLDDWGWPAADREIDAGQATIAAAQLDGVTYMQHAQDVAMSEVGLFFFDGRGFAVFHDRVRRLTAPYTTPRLTFGDGEGEVPYEDCKIRNDRALLKNHWEVTATGGVTQVAEDATSILDNRVRRETRSVIVSSDPQALALAQALVIRFADPPPRFEMIEINPVAVAESYPGLWRALFELNVSDRVRVKKTPPGGGGPWAYDCNIEGRQIDIGPGNALIIRFILSPADTVGYWMLEVPGHSELDSTTVLGY